MRSSLRTPTTPILVGGCLWRPRNHLPSWPPFWRRCNSTSPPSCPSVRSRGHRSTTAPLPLDRRRQRRRRRRLRLRFTSPQPLLQPPRQRGLLARSHPGAPSVDWGLEDRGSFNGQENSYSDAQDYFWSALTAENDTERQRSLALTLRRRSGDPLDPRRGPAAAHPERFSRGSDVSAHARSAGTKESLRSIRRWIGENGAARLRGLRERLASSPARLLGRRDRARHRQFSNRNFVSAGTNFVGPPDNLGPAPGFPSPNGVGAQTSTVDVQTVMPGAESERHHDVHRYAVRRCVHDPSRLQSPHQHLLGLQRGSRRRWAASPLCAESPHLRCSTRAARSARRRLQRGAHRPLLPGDSRDRATGQVHVPGGALPDGNGSFTKLKVKVRNTTPAAETGTGTVQAVVRYRKASLADPLLYPAAAGLDAEPSYAVSKPLENVSIGRELQPLDFDFSESPIPVKVGDISVIVAFRGPLLGPSFTENDAIAFGARDVFEPQLVDFGNSTDYDCYKGALFDVVGATAAQRDVNRDGQRDLFGPVTETGAYVKLQPSATPADWFAPDTASFASPGFRYAEFARFVAVQDQPKYLLMTEFVEHRRRLQRRVQSAPLLVHHRAEHQPLGREGRTARPRGERLLGRPVQRHVVSTAHGSRELQRLREPNLPERDRVGGPTDAGDLWKSDRERMRRASCRREPCLPSRPCRASSPSR